MKFLEIVIFFTVLGAISSGIGGLLSIFIKSKSNKVVASLYESTAGIMTGIVCFDMIPESFSIASRSYTVFGILCGIFMVYVVDYLVEKNYSCVKKFSSFFKVNQKKKISNTQLIVMISMGLHNMIEGLAIGSGFSYSYSLGFSILLSMFLHDIPEGMIVGITNIKSTDKSINIIVESVIVGACVGIGCLIGLSFGKIDDRYIAFCLSIASGAMLFIVSYDLLVMSKKIINSKTSSILYIIGLILTAIIN